MADQRNTDEAREDEHDSSGAISNDESVLDFLWSPEAAAAPADPAETAEDAAQESENGDDLAGALARYGSWLNSLDGTS